LHSKNYRKIYGTTEQYKDFNPDVHQITAEIENGCIPDSGWLLQ
jgi:hypothetical protein